MRDDAGIIRGPAAEARVGRTHARAPAREGQGPLHVRACVGRGGSVKTYAGIIGEGQCLYWKLFGRYSGIDVKPAADDAPQEVILGRKRNSTEMTKYGRTNDWKL